MTHKTQKAASKSKAERTTKTMGTTGTRTRAAKPKGRAATMHKLVWRHATCKVRHTPDYISTGWSHIEIFVQSPKRAPIPITETGYRSHFLDEAVLAVAGGPVAFFLDWIEREARSKAWAKTEFRWRQLELFPR